MDFSHHTQVPVKLPLAGVITVWITKKTRRPADPHGAELQQLITDEYAAADEEAFAGNSSPEPTRTGPPGAALRDADNATLEERYAL